MSYILDLCDQLASALNTEFPSLGAVSDVAPTLTLETMNVRSVVVDPFGGHSAIQAETRDQHIRVLTPNITIAVRKEVPATGSYRTAFQAEFDLVDDIVDFLMSTGRTIGLFALVNEVENAPIYVETHLRDRNQFTSEIAPQYKTNIE